jgi:dTDP-4-dehydrorhamnose 3,5-epimerase
MEMAMPHINESSIIKDVQIVTLKPFADERGRFMETFRKEWFPQRSWEIIQSNRSDSKAGVLRGLHYHFNQVDYWYVANGSIRAGLADLRPDSSTYGAVETIETLTYIVDNYYDGADEYGVVWNDPDLAVPWDARSPIVSARDAANPLLRDIPAESLPK